MVLDELLRVEIKRRSLLKIVFRLGLGTLAASLVQPPIVKAQRKSNSDTLTTDAEKQNYIDTTMVGKKPDYITVEFTTPQILQELKEKYDYTPPKGVFGVTIPVDLDKVGKGADSKVYVFDSFFELYNQFPQFRKDLEFMLRNYLVNHEFVHAKHLKYGISDYPIDLFKDSDGNLNKKLYEAVTEIIANRAEYITLLEDDRIKSSRFLRNIASEARGLAKGYYNTFSDPQATKNMNKDFIERLKQDLDPTKLFKQLN